MRSPARYSISGLGKQCPFLMRTHRRRAGWQPVVLRYEGFRCFFCSNEGSPREPDPVHVRSAGSEAKIWLEPQVTVATSCGFDAATLRERVGVPLAWFPRLLAATPAQRQLFELSPLGVRWDALDEDISIDGLLAGHGNRTHARSVSSA